MRYFDHDTGASTDAKVTELRIACGGAAVDAYWCIVEMIYRDETPLVLLGNPVGNRDGNPVGSRDRTNVVCHWLCVDGETLGRWLAAMLEIGLLERDAENPDAVTSRRAMANIEAYVERRETARRNGRKGGRKPTRKPKANRVGSEGGTDAETEGLANKRKVLVTHKGLPNTVATDVAAAAEAAPPAAKRPLCPLCGVPLWRDTQTGRLHCDECGDAFEGAKALWR